MAERLTNTLEETPTKGFGLKFCSDRNCNTDEDCCNCYAFNQTINKLRQLEDIMEKYGVDVEKLNQMLEWLFTLSGQDADDMKFIARDRKLIHQQYCDIKTDRDTWKRACELACENMKLPVDILIGNKEFNECHSIVEYFYQKAKKEGENGD